MATAKKTTTKKTSIKMDSKLLIAFDSLIRERLIASSAAATVYNPKLNLPSKKVNVVFDTKTAQQISKLLRKGLDDPSAASYKTNRKNSLKPKKK